MQGSVVSGDDYVMCPSEDWIASALSFDGESQYAVFTGAEMKSEITWKDKKRTVIFPGAKRTTVDMQTNGFLIEAVLRFDGDADGGGLAGKPGASGYQLSIDGAGRPALRIDVDGATAITTTAAKPLTVGAWQHVVVEVDRSERDGVRFYIDARPVSMTVAGDMPARTASLANDSDFLVARDADGNHLKVTLDFLRVCRATLATARTSIDGLYAWQFAGPHLKTWWGEEVGE